MNELNRIKHHHMGIMPNRFPFRKLWPLASLVFGFICPAAFAAEPVRFIPATPDNTTLMDGSPVNIKEGEGDWKWLPDEGNQGIFESYGDPKKNAPCLIIHARGLGPGRDYEVYGFFWTHGFGQAVGANRPAPVPRPQ